MVALNFFFHFDLYKKYILYCNSIHKRECVCVFVCETSLMKQYLSLLYAVHSDIFYSITLIL